MSQYGPKKVPNETHLKHFAMLKKVWWVHLSHHLPLLVPRLSSWWRQGTPSSLPPSPPPFENHFHFYSNLAQWLRSDLLVEHHRQFDFILKHSKHVGGAGWEGINVFWWQGFSNKYVLDDNSQWRQRCSLNGRVLEKLLLEPTQLHLCVPFQNLLKLSVWFRQDPCLILRSTCVGEAD